MYATSRALKAALVILLGASLGQLGCSKSGPPGNTSPAEPAKAGPAAVGKAPHAATKEITKPAVEAGTKAPAEPVTAEKPVAEEEPIAAKKTAKMAESMPSADEAVARAESARDRRIEPPRTGPAHVPEKEPTPPPAPVDGPPAAPNAAGELAYLPAGTASALAIHVRSLLDPATADKLAGFAAGSGAERLVPKAGEVLAGLTHVVFLQLRQPKKETAKVGDPEADCAAAADNLMKLMAARMPNRDAPPGVREQIISACKKAPEAAPCLAKAKELADIKECGQALMGRGSSDEPAKAVVFLGDFDAAKLVGTLPPFLKARAVGPNAIVLGSAKAVDAVAAARANDAPRAASNSLVTKLLDRVDGKAAVVGFLFGDGDPTKPEAAALSMAFSEKVELDGWVKGNAPEALVNKLRDELSAVLDERFAKLQVGDAGPLPKHEIDKLVAAIRELTSSLQLDNEPGGVRVRAVTAYDLPAAIKRWSTLEMPKPKPPADTDALELKLKEEMLRKKAEEEAKMRELDAKAAAMAAKKKALEAKKKALEAKEKALRDSLKK